MILKNIIKYITHTQFLIGPLYISYNSTNFLLKTHNFTRIFVNQPCLDSFISNTLAFSMSVLLLGLNNKIILIYSNKLNLFFPDAISVYFRGYIINYGYSFIHYIIGIYDCNHLLINLSYITIALKQNNIL